MFYDPDNQNSMLRAPWSSDIFPETKIEEPWTQTFWGTALHVFLGAVLTTEIVYYLITK